MDYDQQQQAHENQIDRSYQLFLTEITQSKLKEMFVLNVNTGQFTRRIDRYGRPYSPGDEPEIVKGSKVSKKSKSLTMMVKGRSYAYHRLVYLYVHGEMPPGRLGFIDDDSTNTTPANLALIPDGHRTLPKQPEVSFL